MKYPKILAVFVCLNLLCLIPAYAQEMTPEKHAEIEKLLEVTGSMKIGQQMSRVMVGQLNNAIRATHPDVPDRVMKAIPEAVNGIIDEHLNEFAQIMIHIYDKYYTEDEIKQLIQFYSSGVGKKSIEQTPTIMQEGMEAGKQWGRSLGPEINKRLVEQFKKENFDL